MAKSNGRKRGTPFQKLYAKGQGSSFLRTSGKLAGTWQAVWTYRDEDDCKKRKYFYGKTEKEAREKMRDWLSGGGEERQGKDWTVTDLFEYLLAESSKENPKGGYFEQQKRQKPNTIYDYRSQWRRLVKPVIGHMDVHRVRSSHLDKVLLKMLADDMAKRSVLNVRRMIAVCFKEGVRLGKLKDNPAPNMMKVEIPRYRASNYTQEHIGKLIETTAGKPIQLGIMLAGICGLRESEIAGLMRSDFDPKTGVLKIERQYRQVKGGGLVFDKPKTEAGTRSMAVPAMVAEALSNAPTTSLYYFPSQKDPGRPMHPTGLWKAATAAMIEAKVPQIRFHDLRHSANNILKQLGVDAATRRDILGHSTTAITENIYTQTVSSEVADAMDLVGKAYGTRVVEDALSKADSV